MAEWLERTSVRVLLVDSDDRILLLRGSDPGRPDLGQWWFTVGGGLEPGEDPVTAACREITEETGLRVRPEEIGPAVWTGRTVFPWLGRVYDQTETYHVVRCGRFDPDTSGFDAQEAQAVAGWRWWTVAELVAHDGAPIRPRALGELLPRVLAGPWQGAALDLGLLVEID
jgi:8-oxo-dGTP pyrophosphatase MutT (NUDIX family)